MLNAVIRNLDIDQDSVLILPPSDFNIFCITMHFLYNNVFQEADI